MRPKVIVTILLVLALFATLCIAQVVNQNSDRIPDFNGATFEFNSAEFQFDSSVTLEEKKEAVSAYLNAGTAPPAGVTVVEPNAAIGVEQTSLKLQTPDGQLVQYLVTVVEDKASDLQSAEILVNGQVVITATRAAGTIIDSSDGTTVATLTPIVNAHDTHLIELNLYNDAGQRLNYNFTW